MKKVTLSVDTGFVGAEHTAIIEVPDDITEDELDDMAETFMQECISYGWCCLEDEEED